MTYNASNSLPPAGMRLCDRHLNSVEGEEAERKMQFSLLLKRGMTVEEVDAMIQEEKKSRADLSPTSSPNYFDTEFPTSIADMDTFSNEYRMYNHRPGTLAAAPSFNTLVTMAGAVDTGPIGILANRDDNVHDCIPLHKMRPFLPKNNNKVTFDLPPLPEEPAKFPKRNNAIKSQPVAVPTRSSPRKRKPVSLDEVASRPEASRRAVLEEASPSRRHRYRAY
ncbi:hypothetical protein BDQ17DRAFT_220003 [Cyathus striatus]|nr:hypothetical protein BDQ17DRAFT_220003 [Cyathus striatus]